MMIISHSSDTWMLHSACKIVLKKNRDFNVDIICGILYNFTYIIRLHAESLLVTSNFIIHAMVSFEADSFEIAASKIETIRWRLISIIDVPLVLATPTKDGMISTWMSRLLIKRSSLSKNREVFTIPPYSLWTFARIKHVNDIVHAPVTYIFVHMLPFGRLLRCAYTFSTLKTHKARREN